MCYVVNIMLEGIEGWVTALPSLASEGPSLPGISRLPSLLSSSTIQQGTNTSFLILLEEKIYAVVTMSNV